MPTSHFYQLNEITQLIALTDPASILDIGVGFGKYGFLSREYLEVWNTSQPYGTWTRRIDGIEVFPEYITPVHKYIYDHIYLGNAIDILATLEKRYDLILLIDILEHFDYAQGTKLLEDCMEHGRNIIISTPRFFSPQKETFENSFETHKFLWEKRHLSQIDRDKFFISNPHSLICYVGLDSARIKSGKRSMDIKSQLKKYFPLLVTQYGNVKRAIHHA